jgi:hypothetical protein
MFGWLAARSPLLCRRAPRMPVSRRVRRITSHTLINALPGLGSVLYMHAGTSAETPGALPPGLLIAERTLAPLLDVHWLVAVSAVTDEGPREWCECVDRMGCTRARWYLLPDTDYLAWDALTSSCDVHISVPDAQPLRPDRGLVANFRLRDFGGMQLLEQRAAMVLSPLGLRIAARIAQAESVCLAV